MSQIIVACTLITLMLATLAGVGAAIVWVWEKLRKMGRLADDMLGEPARPGHPVATPGLLDQVKGITDMLSALVPRVEQLELRLLAVEAQLKPNGGNSIRDAVDRLAPSPDGGK